MLALQKKALHCCDDGRLAACLRSRSLRFAAGSIKIALQK
jgi:hypothetical protein